MKESKSLPADIRNGGFQSEPTEQIYWGDDGRSMGYYIGVLATEYRLLKDNGQNTDETVTELFYALHTLFRLDSSAIELWNHYQGIGAFGSHVSFPGKGYMMADDIGAYELDWQLQNTPNLPSGLNAINYYTTIVGEKHSGIVGPVNGVSSGYSGLQNDLLSLNPYTVLTNDNLYSVDNYIAVLMGLSLAVKCLDPGINSFYEPNSNLVSLPAIGYPDLQKMASELGDAILDYIVMNTQQCFLLFPDFTGVSGGSTFAWLKPLSEIGFGNSFNVSLASSATWNTYVLCDALGTCSSPQIQNVEMACELAAMSGDGGAHLYPSLLIKAFGDYGNSAPSCVFCQTPQANQYGWDLFYNAILKILHPSLAIVLAQDYCDMLDIINSAPEEGPFNHDKITLDHASCNWASDKRFAQQPPTQSDGNFNGKQTVGNYTGLDYMLFYNLYYLMMEQNQGPIIVDDNSTILAAASVDQLTGNITAGYPDTYPFNAVQYIPFDATWDVYGYTGQPYTIANENCSPIIVDKLWVRNAAFVHYGPVISNTYVTLTGDLNLYGSDQSYIDLVPPLGSSVIIEKGTNFDAVPSRPCPNCVINVVSNYHFEPDPDPNGLSGADQRKGSYQKTPEFDTAYSTKAFNNYPNPFTTSTTIDFSLPNDEPISLYIMATNGQIIGKLIDNETYSKGGHVINYNGSELATGTYVAVLVTRDGKKTLKMIKTR